MIKGLKGNYDPLLKWLQFIDLNSNKLISVIRTDDESIEIALETLKSGLLSKNSDIAIWTSRLLVKLIEEMIEQNLEPAIWNWFCKDSGGLNTCLIGLKRQPIIKDYIGNLFVIIGKYNISELLTVELKKVTSDNLEYFNLIHSFLEVFKNMNTISLQVSYLF